MTALSFFHLIVFLSCCSRCLDYFWLGGGKFPDVICDHVEAGLEGGDKENSTKLCWNRSADRLFLNWKKRKGAGGVGEKEGSEVLYNVLEVIPPVNMKICFTGIWVAGAWFMWIWVSVLYDMHRKHHENICSKCVNFRAAVKFLLGLTQDFSDLGTWIHFLIFVTCISYYYN